MQAFLRKLGWIATRRRKEADLREELEFHLAEEAEERKAIGLTEDQARFAARREFGSLALIAEATGATWGWPVLEQFVQDVRQGARALVRNPGLAVMAIVTFGLGIGMTTAIFSVVYGILLRPLPLHESDRLVMVSTIEGSDESGAVSPPNFMSLAEDLSEGSRSISDIAGFTGTEVTLTGAGEARRIRGARVSVRFFETLHTAPVLGRTFRREEHDAGRGHVVVLSHALWQQQFGGHHGVINRGVVLNGVPHAVVGIMAPGFGFPYGGDFWIPQSYTGYYSSSSIAGRKSNTLVGVIARLLPNVRLEAARSELRLLGRRLEERFPQTNSGVTFSAIALRDDLVGDVRSTLLLLLGAVGLVLLISSANVAGLLLARTASRREEIAVRTALGAGHGRVVRQLVTEALVLGVGGSLLGLLVSHWASRSIAAAYGDGLQRLGLAEAIRLDGPILAFALVITLMASTLAGLAPAFRLGERALGESLQAGGRSRIATRHGQRLRSGLVVAQLALAMVLLVGAGLLIKSFLRLTAVDPGIHTERILTFRLALPAGAYGSTRIVQFYDRLLERLEHRPGIESAAAVFRLPVRQSTFGSRFRLERDIDTEQVERSIGVQVVTPGYFDALGVRILHGRGFTHDDRAGALPVVLLNETAAKSLFPFDEPIGRRLVQFSYDPLENAADAFTVVGIVADVRTSGLSEELEPEAYFAHAQIPQAGMFVAVRTIGEPLDIARAVREEVGALDRAVPIIELRSMQHVIAESVVRERMLARFVGMFSAVALTLAAVGVFGLVSFAVTERTREIGVRIALGASRGNAVGHILRHISRLVLTGLAIGVVSALALTRMLESELFDVSPTDPAAFTAVTIILGATALLASVIPAWRAATVDPLVALRTD
jgi:putative ABC transport system permease protein